MIDTIRGLVHRDFEMAHPAQLLGEKMVDLKVNKDGNFRTAKITYDMFLINLNILQMYCLKT